MPVTDRFRIYKWLLYSLLVGHCNETCCEDDHNTVIDDTSAERFAAAKEVLTAAFEGEDGDANLIRLKELVVDIVKLLLFGGSGSTTCFFADWKSGRGRLRLYVDDSQQTETRDDSPLDPTNWTKFVLDFPEGIQTRFFAWVKADGRLTETVLNARYLSEHLMPVTVIDADTRRLERPSESDSACSCEDEWGFPLSKKAKQ